MICFFICCGFLLSIFFTIVKLHENALLLNWTWIEEQPKQQVTCVVNDKQEWWNMWNSPKSSIILPSWWINYTPGALYLFHFHWALKTCWNWAFKLKTSPNVFSRLLIIFTARRTPLIPSTVQCCFYLFCASKILLLGNKYRSVIRTVFVRQCRPECIVYVHFMPSRMGIVNQYNVCSVYCLVYIPVYLVIPALLW